MDWSDIDRASIARDVIEWDVLNWGRVLQYWSKRLPGPLDGSRVLTLGERNGGLTLLYALLGAEVVCSDYGGPTDAARDLHKRYGVQDQVQYLDIDATQVALPDEEFDFVAFKSMLGALQTWDRQVAAVHEIQRVLKQKGMLLFAENLRASPAHRLARWAIPGDSWMRWRFVTPGELNTLFDGFAHFDMTAFGFASVFARWEAGRALVHRFDRVVDPVVPSSWKYIAFGTATKS